MLGNYIEFVNKISTLLFAEIVPMRISGGLKASLSPSTFAAADFASSFYFISVA